MQRLLLLRHGKSLETSSSGRDFDRTLSALGVWNSVSAGYDVIKAMEGLPRLVLVSGAVRAQETWHRVEGAWVWERAKPGAVEPQVVADQRIYGASVEALCLVVKEGVEGYGKGDEAKGGAKGSGRAKSDAGGAGADMDMSVLVIGHNPGLMLLAQWLIGDAGEAIPHLPTAGLVNIKVPELAGLAEAKGKGELLGFYRP